MSDASTTLNAGDSSTPGAMDYRSAFAAHDAQNSGESAIPASDDVNDLSDDAPSDGANEDEAGDEIVGGATETTTEGEPAAPWHKDARFKADLDNLKTLSDPDAKATVAALREAGVPPAEIKELLAFRDVVTELKGQGFTSAADVCAAIDKQDQEREAQRIQQELYDYQQSLQTDERTAYLDPEIQNQLLAARQIQMENQANQRFLAGQVQNQAITQARTILPDMTPETERMLRQFAPDQVAGVAKVLKAQFDLAENNAVTKYAATKLKDARTLTPENGGGSGKGATNRAPNRSAADSGKPDWKRSYADLFAEKANKGSA